MRKALHVVPVICLLLFAGALRAQNTNSVDIRGTVTDASNAVVPAWR